MSNLQNCPFCRIASGLDQKALRVFANERLIAFFPTAPAVLGHTLLIPRAHERDIFSMTPETAGALAETVRPLALAIRDFTGASGLNLIQSNGKAATQTVSHIHVHFVPRWEDDQIGNIWPESPQYTKEEMHRAAAGINETLLGRLECNRQDQRET